MNKLLFLAFLMLCFSCKKEASINSAKSAQVTTSGIGAVGSASAVKITNVAAAPGTTNPTNNTNYVDLTLRPRNAGENFDTYTTNFHGIYMIVTGNPSWDFVKYPCLVTGVPTVYGGVGVDAALYQSAGPNLANIPQITSVSDLTGQTVFNLQAIYISIKTDSHGGSSFGTGTVVNYPGKLIRVTTGSHWGMTDASSYPMPPANTGCPVQGPPPADI